jgi:16S rRNA (guanine527-N7)-methyltransferase
MEKILHYFPELTSTQKNQFQNLFPLFEEWNAQINVISRKDMINFYEHHVLHSLSIAKYIRFKNNSSILDAGTGGGFPGIPLAILFPEVKFHLVDSVGKKIKVVDAIRKELLLKNITTQQVRMEELHEKYDFILSRSVASLRIFYDWSRNLISNKNQNEIKNGWLILKGGDLKNELQELKRKTKLIPVSDFFEEEYFKEKMIVNFS